VAHVDGWLDGYYPLTILHGESKGSVDPHYNSSGTDLSQLLAGDCAGYTDSTGTNGPDNQVDNTDLNAVMGAYDTTPDSSDWNAYCDFSGDNHVHVEDLTLCVTNLNTNGVPPIYRFPVGGPPPVFEIVDLDTCTDGPRRGLVIHGARDLVAWEARLGRLWAEPEEFRYYSLPGQDEGAATLSRNYPHSTVLVAARRGNLAGYSGDALLVSWPLGAEPATGVSLLTCSQVNSAFVRSAGYTGLEVEDFTLLPAYPNPFNGTVRIPFLVTREQNLELEIYNLLGQRVSRLLNGRFPAGSYDEQWCPEGLAAGIYLIRLHGEGRQSLLKVTHLK
jgi:hypothetical protein